MQMWEIEMTEKPKDIEKYFENSKCKICGVVVQPHFQGNTKLPKEEHLAKMHQDLEWTRYDDVLSLSFKLSYYVVNWKSITMSPQRNRMQSRKV